MALLSITILYTIRWRDFERKFSLHFPWCGRLLQNPSSKISCLNVACHRASENVDCCRKIRRKKVCLKRFFKPAAGGNVLFDFSKLKMKRNSHKKLFFHCPDQKNCFAHFGGMKKILSKFQLKTLFLAIFLCSKRKVFANFKKIKCLRDSTSSDFFNGNFAAVKVADFLFFIFDRQKV